MTSMEQIAQLEREAMAHGMSYGKYVDKFKPKMPEPEKKKRTAREEIAARKRYKERITHDVVCKMCGDQFTAKRKDASFCEKCKRRKASEAVKQWKQKKKEGEAV